MIQIIPNGDIFTSGCQVLVNPVNCVGVCGKGLALEFKKRFPDEYERYKIACKKQLFFAGRIRRYNDIIFAATKDHWKNSSQIEWVQTILEKIADNIYEYSYPSIAIPALGCGEGGLDWNVVKPLMLSILEPVADKCEIKIYEPK